MTTRRWRRGTALLAPCCALLLVAPLPAAPSVWERAKDPSAQPRAELMARADHKREPVDATFDSPAIRMQLHRAAATWLDMASVESMGDIDLLYLFGECLASAGAQYQARAKRVLERALQQAPDHPAAPQAWLSLGSVAASLGDYTLQYTALEHVFDREWRQQVRIDALISQGLGAMRLVNLETAIERLEGAHVGAAEARQWALAQWAMAVAMDRSLRGPQAATLAYTASLAVFGPSGQADVLALAQTPMPSAAEIFYYRALAHMGKARVVSEQERQRIYQEAKFLWLRYLDASGSDLTWHRRVRQHLQAIERDSLNAPAEAEDLDALAAAPPEFSAQDAGVEPLWPDELVQGDRFWNADAGVDSSSSLY